MTKVLSCSSDMKSEYCCSVVRVENLTSIEGSDFLAKTNVFNTQIVVRKDQITEGNIYFYAANETALNEKFLSINNLFEISCRDKNSNAQEIESIMKDYDLNYRNRATELKNQAKNIKSSITSLTNSSNRFKKKVKQLQKEKETLTDISRIEEIDNEISELTAKADDKLKRAMAKTTEYTNIKNEADELVKAGAPIVEKAKKLCGFFNKYGRVRCITLKGEPSFGFLFSVEEMAKFYPDIKNVNLEDYINQDFDTVGDMLFVKAFVPPVKEVRRSSNKEGKRNKKISRFDRMIDGEFFFHYDTQKLEKNMHKFKPSDVVAISLKIHGTSLCVGKLRVKEPKRIPPHKWLWNKLVDFSGLFTSTRFVDFNVTYGPVYSSRTVIKNQYINKNVNSGYYNSDIWSEWGDKIYPYLEEGITVYGEIMGYVTGSDKMIQKSYDYGCKQGENKLMIYRITSTRDDGSKYEWNVPEVKEWTEMLVKRMKKANDNTYKAIHPIDILYHGTLADLYPEIDTENHWQENVYQKLKNDKEHFGMEENEPLCTQFETPREGLVIRIDNDPISEAFKCKSLSFLYGEAIRMDAGEVDIEMLDNYVSNDKEQDDNTTEEA